MDINSLVTFIIFFFACIYLYKLIVSNIGNGKNKEQLILRERIKLIEEETQKKHIVLEQIEQFLKTAQFVEPIGTWRGEKIYRYISTNNNVYEFDDIMPENNQKTVLSEDFLCFNQLSYVKSIKHENRN